MNKSSALILVLIAIGIFYTFISPQYGDAQMLEAEAAKYRDLIANVSRITESRDNLSNSFESIPASEKMRLLKVLPDNVDAVGLARDLDTIASKYGIAIRTVTVEDEPSNNAGRIVIPNDALPYEKAYVSFSFVSDYANFMKFLADLEKSLRIMDVQEVSFQTAESGLYEHKITVETYWLK